MATTVDKSHDDAFLKHGTRAESASMAQSRRASITSGHTLSTFSKNFVYLDKVVREWTADPEVRHKDPLVLG